MSVTTLCGNNRYEIGQELKKRKKIFIEARGNDESAIERIDATSIVEKDEAIELLNRMMSPSLFATHKLVVMRDLSKNNVLLEKFLDWLDKYNPKDDDHTIELVIVEPNLDKRSKLFKELKAKSEFKELNITQPAMLSEWVTSVVKESNGTINKIDANYLVDRAGPDQQRLASEIDKLLTYNQNISRTSIDELVEPSINSSTFDLADAVFSRNRAKALRLYQEQRQKRVEPILIIGSLAWQLQLLLLVKSADVELSSDQIAKDSGMNPWAISKAKQLAKSITNQDLKLAIDRLLEIDTKSKSARNYNSDDALQYYLLSI